MWKSHSVLNVVFPKALSEAPLNSSMNRVMMYTFIENIIKLIVVKCPETPIIWWKFIIYNNIDGVLKNWKNSNKNTFFKNKNEPWNNRNCVAKSSLSMRWYISRDRSIPTFPALIFVSKAVIFANPVSRPKKSWKIYKFKIP